MIASDYGMRKLRKRTGQFPPRDLQTLEPVYTAEKTARQVIRPGSSYKFVFCLFIKFLNFERARRARIKIWIL